MVRIFDDRIRQARHDRNNRVRERWYQLYGVRKLRYEVCMDMCIREFALSESTISQIINNYGHYKHTKP